ncbi:hypothetical protein L3556_15220 [Candidatus Synechococcus calcipolaris G9]|uniref:Transcriptional regulator n=1 Tax=Candidatus Synechococcus calcipolaris G9 TaxID=1497997 RepID=A0ABT6F353_9SYNE|nr:Npun_F0494 family protein [Candidatus Synechococcus calcipolaris]MDG2992269.1 hypothetical protein [Candidatus Synechococcus calcipolaris G9]
MQYAAKTLERAERALRCSPFLPRLFIQMGQRSVSILDIAQQAGIEQQFTPAPLSLLAAESSLDWLLQVGLLRREVDGQGLTDRFRLTPLGQQVLLRVQTGTDSDSQDTWAGVSWGDRLQNTLTRWLH